MKLIAAFLMILLCSFSVLAIDAFVKNMDVRVVAEFKEGQENLIEGTVSVGNINEVPVTIYLEASGDLSEITSFDDNNFVLEPGENRDVVFTSKVEKPGLYTGKVDVAFKPEKGAGTAISVNVNLEVSGETSEVEETEETDEEETGDVKITGATTSSGKASVIKGIILIILIVVVGLLLFSLIFPKAEKENK